MRNTRYFAAGAILGVVLAAACGDKDRNPAASTPTPTPSPTPPLVVATPTPSPTPTPGAAFACGASVVTGAGGCNGDPAPTFDQDIEEAIDHAIAMGAGTAGNRITSEGRYIVDILNTLQEKGFCADYDGEEVQIKRNNDFHEQYDVVLASGFVRRGPGAYRVKCTPAQFPLPKDPIFPVGGCTIGASREKACGRDDDGGVFLRAIDEAVNAAKNMHPENYDRERVRDGELYQNDVVAALTAAGFCAKTDYEEVSIKNANEFSENYDILLASREIRRGRGSYRVSCFPASF